MGMDINEEIKKIEDSIRDLYAQVDVESERAVRLVADSLTDGSLSTDEALTLSESSFFVSEALSLVERPRFPYLEDIVLTDRAMNLTLKLGEKWVGREDLSISVIEHVARIYKEWKQDHPGVVFTIDILPGKDDKGPFVLSLHVDHDDEGTPHTKISTADTKAGRNTGAFLRAWSDRFSH